LPNHALAFGLILWREEAGQGSPVRIVLKEAGAGLSERTAKRALGVLEEAGLVTANRLPGQGVDVTLPGGGSGAFLLGPLPWGWLDRAARLPGQALAVGLILWFRHGLTGAKALRLCLERVGFAVSEQAGRRAVRALEGAGLVSVVRRPGRGLDVTILDTLESG
jgi:DNA-binding transcriptional ArsR family regulator